MKFVMIYSKKKECFVISLKLLFCVFLFIHHRVSVESFHYMV